MEGTRGRIRFATVVGDIADQPDLDAVVNAANAELRSGGGVAGAIHAKAGPGLAEEARPFAPIRPGDAVITGAHGLPNRYVIHCLGPVYGRDEPAADLLARCHAEALARAEERGVRSVGFPALSTGAFGYPTQEAAEVAVAEVVRRAAGLESVERIRFVLFREEDERVYAAALRRHLADEASG